MPLHSNDPIAIERRLRETPTYAVPLMWAAKADLPNPSPAGCWIYVTDEAGGAVPAFSDGTNWRRCTDRAVVS